MALQRRLGHIETLMSLMHDKLDGTSQGMPVAVLRGTLSNAAVSAAAQRLYAKYGLLRCVIQRRDNDYHFVEATPFDAIPLEFVTLHDGQDEHAFLQRELHRVIDASRHLWRVVLLSNVQRDKHWLMLVCHHAIIDTDGFYTLMRELLQGIDRHMETAFDPIAIDHDAAAMPPAIDQFLNSHTPQAQDNPISCAAIDYASQCALAQRVTRYQRCSLGAQQYQQLQSACKRDLVRVNSVLAALFCQVAHKAGLLSSPLRFKSAVSLRDRAAVQDAYHNQLACYISVADTVLAPHNTQLVPLAAEYERKLMMFIVRHCLSKKTVNLNSLAEHMAQQAHNTQFEGIGISNLGVVEIPTLYSHFELVDYLPLTNRVAGNYAIVLHAAVFQGELQLFFIYPQPLVKVETVHTIVEIFSRKLSAYALSEALDKTSVAADA